MRKKIATGLIGILLLALLVWAFIPSPKDVEVAPLTQGLFERAVQEDGKTRVRDRYLITAPITGRVGRLDWKQGDAVSPQAIVATIWPTAPELLDDRARAEQMAQSASLQAAMEKAQTNAERAGAALEQAQAVLKRSEALVLQGFVSPNQNENERLNVRLREKEQISAQQEVHVARYALLQSRTALQQFSQAMPIGSHPRFAVKAPIGARVLKILQQSEGLIVAGTPLIELGDPKQMEVVASILTEDAAQIKPGTPVQMTHWGGQAPLLGEVRLVEPSAFTKVSALGVEEQRVNVIIDITSPQQQWSSLGDGFKVDVRLLVQVVEQALKVPVSAIFPVGSRSGFFLLKGNRAQLSEIEVISRNGVEAWIKSALAPGTLVVVYPDTKLKDQDRVKPR